MKDAPRIMVFNTEGTRVKTTFGFGLSELDGALAASPSKQPTGITTPHDDTPTLKS